MSVDIQWETLTAGPDGARLAETIRAFIHDKFQQVTLPRFIRSVQVRSFDFGTVPPELELKDICDPLPEFYEESQDDDNDHDRSASASSNNGDSQALHDSLAPAAARSPVATTREQLSSSPAGPGTGQPCDRTYSKRNRLPEHIDTRRTGLQDSLNRAVQNEILASPPFTNIQSPGIPGGTSNLTYFHLPLGAGLSGTTTPLAAVAGAAHFHHNQRQEYASAIRRHSPPDASRQPPASVISLTPPSTADPSSRPPSQHHHESTRASSVAGLEDTIPEEPISFAPSPVLIHEQSPEDIQIVAHVKYSGNLKLSLTAEILLDYPMPSFVGIPLQLNITGFVFDGIAILAHIKKRAHFCFLSPEDAEALIGRENDLEDSAEMQTTTRHAKVGGLLEYIKVESEIGDKENGKQVLKNVGKVEKFVLEQVRRIFEDELVYPSFWTFLV